MNNIAICEKCNQIAKVQMIEINGIPKILCSDCVEKNVYN